MNFVHKFHLLSIFMLSNAISAAFVSNLKSDVDFHALLKSKTADREKDPSVENHEYFDFESVISIT